MPIKIVAVAPGKVELQSFDLPPSRPDRILVKNLTSLISPGTEGIILHRRFEPGSHYDQFAKLPFSMGYCSVAEILEIGSELDDCQLKVGERVFVRRGHGSHHQVSVEECTKIPDDIDSDIAQWSALAMIGSMVLNAGDIRLSDDVTIIGGGPVGQLALRWCKAAGCRVLLVDPSEFRTALAKAGGADFIEIGNAVEAVESSKNCFGDQPRVAIDTTGIPSVFEQCLKIPRNYGVLVLLGDAGKPSEQRLTPDVVIRGVQIRGAHITHETPTWTERKSHRKFYELLITNRLNMDGMNTHCFCPEDCQQAYDLLASSESHRTMGVWFDWR